MCIDDLPTCAATPFFPTTIFSLIDGFGLSAVSSRSDGFFPTGTIFSPSINISASTAGPTSCFKSFPKFRTCPVCSNVAELIAFKSSSLNSGTSSISPFSSLGV